PLLMKFELHGKNKDVIEFKMSKSRNLLKNRSQNYALIRLLNWLRTTN
ncbi:hypothetical protein WED14_12415, partial [Staphylococcus aureus]